MDCEGRIFCGLDMGSRMAKGVLVGDDGVLTQVAMEQRPRGGLGEELVDRLLREARMRRGEVTLTLATGYGRAAAPSDGLATEVTCQILGVRHGVSNARTIVDVGGQDTKVIYVGERGVADDFAMNDKCAAGTGRFLEKMAELLGTDAIGLGRLAAASARACRVTSTCVVFAETEIIGLLASGRAPADIACGVQVAVASRIRSMIDREVVPVVAFTGGVALIPGMAERLAEALDTAVEVVPGAQFSCAAGAALLARHRWEADRSEEEE